MVSMTSLSCGRWCLTRYNRGLSLWNWQQFSIVDCNGVNLKPAFTSINLMDIDRIMTSFYTVSSFVAEVGIAVLRLQYKN